MQVPRPVVPAVLLVVATLVVPLAGVALANAVRPVIAPAPVASVDPAADVPAMPDAPASVQPLARWFEALPVVEPGPDAAPRPFLALYRELPVGDPAAAANLIDVAFGEIEVPASAQPVTRELLDALILPPTEAEEPDPDLDPEETPAVGTFDTAAFKALSERAMNEIATTPSNAQAVNDLAVAIATTWLSDPAAVSFGPDPNATIADASQLQEAATELLELGLASFPGDRTMTINLAYLRSLEPGPEELASSSVSDALAPAVAGLESYIGDAPTDATAASLLANLLVLTDPAHGLERAIAIAQPLLDNADSEAAGRIVRADALMHAADGHRDGSPFLARTEVRRALADYDRAIEITGDAHAFAGRARALDLLGSREAAVEAQEEAVRLIPSSGPWRMWLAQLQRCTSNVGAWRRDGEAALKAAEAASKAPPLMLATRNMIVDRPGSDFGRFSIGSDLTVRDVTSGEPPTGGAVIISSIDPFPEPEACVLEDPTSTALEGATMEFVLAAIADDDLNAARVALAPWHVDATSDGEEGEEGEEDDGPEGETAANAATVLGLLSGEELFEGDDAIRLFLPLASGLPPAAQARLCEQLAAVRGLASEDVDALMVCAAEALDRTGDHDSAAGAIDHAVRLDDPIHPPNGATALAAGMLSELTGHLDNARARYQVAAAHAETSIGGLARLGDLDLRQSDASAALAHYALAAAAIRLQSAGEVDKIVLDDGTAARLAQYIDNNRGIALLMTARTEPDAPPDCAAFEAVCRQAADAFAAAMAADPMNPVYPMNAAWVARLTGDEARATALLQEALGEGIPLRSAAHNDLGVLAARRGDMAEAGSQFRRAIELEPDYDLATWNLGVLEARQGGPLVVAGQALLGRATELNPDLLTRELAFQTDERVYRVEVSGTQLELARAPGTGAAVGAAAFGAIATVGALAQLFGGLGGDVKDAAETVSTQGLARATRRLRGLGAGVRLADRGWPSWAAWIPAIIVLVVTTAWTASWMAPDAFGTAVLIGLIAAGLALVVHTCGHLVVAGRFGAKLEASGWTPGLALAVVGMPFHVPAGPFLAEQITTGDPRRDWWVSFAGILANLAAAGIALLIYLWAPMPFLRILIATQLAVAAFALIPSQPLDGDRLATQPIVLALLSLGVAAAATAIAVGAI